MVIVISLIFITVFLLGIAFFLVFKWWTESPAVHLRRRLRRLQTERDDTAGRGTGLLRESARFEKALLEMPLLNKLVSLVHRSGIAAPPSAVLTILAVLSTVAFFVVYLVSSSMITALTGALLVQLPPVGYLCYLKQQREKKFGEQLPEVLMTIARSLRAGHSLPSAIELVSQEMPEPTRGLFKVVYDHQLLGMRMADALQTLLLRITCADLHYFLTIIKINSESGGNLSDILDKLAETINSRLQVRRQVQVLTAEGRISGYILFLLPVFVFFVFRLKNPDYMSLFFTERMCQMALVAATVAQVIGFFFIRKIVNIRI